MFHIYYFLCGWPRVKELSLVIYLCLAMDNKKFELMLMRCAKAYSSSDSVV